MTTTVSKLDIIILSSGDGQVFRVPEAHARKCITLGHILDDIVVDNAPFPLPNIRGEVLKLVLEYCKHHTDSPGTEEALSKWNKHFLKKHSQIMLFELIRASNYLENKSLLDTTCAALARQLRGRTTEDMRMALGIENDFTPDQEATIQRENEWMEEKQ